MLIGDRIDFEEHVALMHELVVLDVYLDDAAVYLGCDPDQIRDHFRVVRLRIDSGLAPHGQTCDNGAGDNQQTKYPAKYCSRHRSSIIEKHEPDGAREQRDHTRVDDDARPEFSIQPRADQYEAGRQRKQDGSPNAEHPNRKERTENVYRG